MLMVPKGAPGVVHLHLPRARTFSVAAGTSTSWKFFDTEAPRKLMFMYVCRRHLSHNIHLSITNYPLHTKCSEYLKAKAGKDQKERSYPDSIFFNYDCIIELFVSLLTLLLLRLLAPSSTLKTEWREATRPKWRWSCRRRQRGKRRCRHGKWIKFVCKCYSTNTPLTRIPLPSVQ